MKNKKQKSKKNDSQNKKKSPQAHGRRHAFVNTNTSNSNHSNYSDGFIDGDSTDRAAAIAQRVKEEKEAAKQLEKEKEKRMEKLQAEARLRRRTPPMVRLAVEEGIKKDEEKEVMLPSASEKLSREELVKSERIVLLPGEELRPEDEEKILGVALTAEEQVVEQENKDKPEAQTGEPKPEEAVLVTSSETASTLEIDVTYDENDDLVINLFPENVNTTAQAVVPVVSTPTVPAKNTVSKRININAIVVKPENSTSNEAAETPVTIGWKGRTVIGAAFAVAGYFATPVLASKLAYAFLLHASAPVVGAVVALALGALTARLVKSALVSIANGVKSLFGYGEIALEATAENKPSSSVTTTVVEPSKTFVPASQNAASTLSTTVKSVETVAVEAARKLAK